MDDENEDSMFIDPEILKKELVISLPILSESDIEMMINGADSSSEDSSSLDERENEKPCLKRDQRRLNLLNNPNYGIILSFMNEFRSCLNIKNYPLRIFEDNLISEQEKMSRRFVDFHLALYKKVSSTKGVERNHFVSSMTKFAYRFNRGDGAHLEECGYPKAKIETKLRILKNLLEKQIDRNQALKNAIADKSASEIRPKPFGRDRFGASYWLFMDTDCFIRIFRENTDDNHTWTNVVKNQQELENLIKVLITDYLVRKKFPEWKFSYESFNSLSSTHEFEERYGSDIKKGNESMRASSPSFVQYRSGFIKTQNVDLDPVVNLDRDPVVELDRDPVVNFIRDPVVNIDRDVSSSPPSSCFSINNIKIRNNLDSQSDQESINSVIINGKRLNSSSSNDTRDEVYSPGFTQELYKNNNSIKTINIAPKIDNDIQATVLKPASEQGIKRKLVDYDDSESESEIEDSEKNDETSQNFHQIPVNNVTKPNEDLPIALRRSRRRNGLRLAELSPDSSSTGKSYSQTSIRKKSINRKWKSSNRLSKTNGRRRRRGKSSMNEFSSTTSDERPPTDDSEDYFPDNGELNSLRNGDLLEEDDNDDDYTPQRKAKTVAQCQVEYKPCVTCSLTDRPELLLLCEDCDDAYHIECVKPELLSIPDDDWYCPLCEHKSLCDNLIEKLHILIKDEAEFEMKRRLYVSKRRKRLTNVTVNLDRYVKQPPPPPPPKPVKRQANRFISSDETSSEKKTNSTDDDVDSVYGQKKNDENRKPSDQEEEEQQGKRRVRSCRRNAKDYSFDDYDKKIKDAMVDAGVHKALVENDSDDSDEIIMKKKSAKKRARYEEDDDFDMSDGKSDGDFVPSRPRIMNGDRKNDNNNNNKKPAIEDDEDTESYDVDDHYDNNDIYGNDDIGMSDEDNAWKNRPKPTTTPKKKPAPKPKRNIRRKSTIRSEDDSTISETNLTAAIKVKSEPTIQSDTNAFPGSGFSINNVGTTALDPNQPGKSVLGNTEGIKYTFNKIQVGIGNETKQRPKRAVTTKKKPVVQQEAVDDEDEKGRPLPARRVRAKKRYGSHDSSLEDDDDYEKSVHKRRLFNHGRAITRTNITAHIKKLLGDDDVEEEEGENGEGPSKDKSSDETKKDDNNNTKQKNKNSEYDEVQLSDDDDFPDDEEILKTTGLINLKKPLTAQKPAAAAIRAPFMPSMASYQFAMADPTAHFDFTCQPETPITQPSESNQTNGDNNPLATS